MQNVIETVPVNHLQVDWQDTLASASYLFHLIKDKPMMVGVTSALSPFINLMTGQMPSQMTSIGSLSGLVLLDWITKIQACRFMKQAVTSKNMREKGFLKLRDYIILYIAGALTVPLVGDVWVFRSLIFTMCMWELWSIAENMNDSGTIPFDIRHIAIFDGIRTMLSGGVMTTPFDGPGTVTPAPDQPADASATPAAPAAPAAVAPPGNLPI